MKSRAKVTIKTDTGTVEEVLEETAHDNTGALLAKLIVNLEHEGRTIYQVNMRAYPGEPPRLK